jgi:hypothetical protein
VVRVPARALLRRGAQLGAPALAPEAPERRLLHVSPGAPHVRRRGGALVHLRGARSRRDVRRRVHGEPGVRHQERAGAGEGLRRRGERSSRASTRSRA